MRNGSSTLSPDDSRGRMDARRKRGSYIPDGGDASCNRCRVPSSGLEQVKRFRDALKTSLLEPNAQSAYQEWLTEVTVAAG